MGSELEIVRVEEAVRLPPFPHDVKEPYRAALKGEWGAMARFYKKYPERLLDPVTIDNDTAFHIAAYSKETELLQFLLGLLKGTAEISKALSYKNSHGDTAFHEVATTDKVEAAELLISKSREAYGNNLEIRLGDILEDRNQLGETPLYRAAALGQTKMLKFFAKRVSNLSVHFYRNDAMSILHIAVLGRHFDTATWLLEKDPGLGASKGINGMTCLHLLAKMPSAFKSSSRISKMETLLYACLPAHRYDDEGATGNALQSGQGTSITSSLRQFNKHGNCIQAISRIYCAIWSYVAKVWPAIDKTWEKKRMHTGALQLTKVLAESDTTWKDDCFKAEDRTISLEKEDSSLDDSTTIYIKIERKQSDTTDQVYTGCRGRDGTTIYSTPLLTGVSEGIVDIFDAIIDAHPQAFEHVSENEENILHVAIRYRQREIFRRVKKMEMIMKYRLASRIDVRGYTILHEVADMGQYNGGKIPGPAFQLQDELKWLERVREIMPSHYGMHRDLDGKTADELFEDTHAELLKKAQEWIKGTAESCSTVAILVATIVFAAAYALPGGTNEHGYPIFLSKHIFLIFTIMDVISIVTSLISVVMFLLILTSPFEQDDFLKYLPGKLKWGFAFLFISVVTAMLSFTATVLLIIHLEKKAWTTTLLYTAALLFPVSLFALMRFPLRDAFFTCLCFISKKSTALLNLILLFFKTSKDKIY